jgi:hypothetical protein
LSRGLEDDLRGLCAWYEWGDQPELARVLQDAADALCVRALSPEAADALIAVWQPFAGLEAQVGNQPKLMELAKSEDEMRRGVVADMRRMVGNETNPAARVRLTRLLDEQIRNFAWGRDEEYRKRVG